MGKFNRSIVLLLAGFGIWQWQRQQRYANRTSIKNKVVIVTGASSGIGLATAKLFAAHGAYIVAAARRTEKLDELKAEVEAEYDTEVIPVTVDLTVEVDIQRLVDTTLERFGRIDVLVNNAGLTHGGNLEDQNPDTISKMLEINLHSIIKLTRAVIPTMKNQRSGQIVNISSVASTAASSGNTIYAATKAGLNLFSRGLRLELASSGIGVSTVLPGWTKTSMIERMDLNKFPGVREGLVEVQTPEFVASHIVAAVRYNTRFVILGGIGMKLIAWTDRLLPAFSEWVFRQFYVRSGVGDTMVNLG